MITTALIGVSGFARWYYRDLVNLARKGAVRLAAAAVINPDEETSKCAELRGLGCEVFADYREMLRAWSGRLDLCFIPTGIPLHAPMTVAALGAGCHVLVEKPAAATLAEVDAMQRAAVEAGRFVAVGFQHIYAPEIARMKRLLLEGAIGRVEVIKCRGVWPRSESYYTRNAWAGRIKVGGSWVLDAPFHNAFAHWLNLLCFLAGGRFEAAANVTSVRAELYRTRPIESADTACLRIETAENIPLLLWVTHSARRINKDDTGPEMEIRGSGGSILWTPETVTIRRSGEPDETCAASGFEQYRAALMGAVLKKAAGEEALVCGLDIARNQTLCANAAFQSSAVHEIAAEHLFESMQPGDSLMAISGIEKWIAESFAQERLWSEMGVPWAVAGEKIAVSPNYAGIGAATALPCAPAATA